MCSRTRGLSQDVGSLGHHAGRRQHMRGNVFALVPQGRFQCRHVLRRGGAHATEHIGGSGHDARGGVLQELAHHGGLRRSLGSQGLQRLGAGHAHVAVARHPLRQRCRGRLRAFHAAQRLGSGHLNSWLLVRQELGDGATVHVHGGQGLARGDNAIHIVAQRFQEGFCLIAHAGETLHRTGLHHGTGILQQLRHRRCAGRGALQLPQGAARGRGHGGRRVLQEVNELGLHPIWVQPNLYQGIDGSGTHFPIL
mmetsp:Transcript_51411/g.111904  ORF Transcript_51411/g.111904 Transcript_51411/m.111904 type:complete len:252 (+) Transcript_51411:143-898(+)